MAYVLIAGLNCDISILTPKVVVDIAATLVVIIPGLVMDLWTKILRRKKNDL
jgi:hypothetical protein